MRWDRKLAWVDGQEKKKNGEEKRDAKEKICNFFLRNTCKEKLQRHMVFFSTH